MNERILKRKVDTENFYYIYLKTLNGHLSLTNRELGVLVELCKLQAKYDDSKLVFSSTSREAIRTQLNISPFNLNNIIKSLRSKKLIITEDKKYYINPKIFVPNTDTEYSINFKIEVTS